MDECIDSLGEASVFTTLDCNSGYWQIPIAKRDQEKTAFIRHAGLFTYKRMPFGMRPRPSSEHSIFYYLATSGRMCLGLEIRRNRESHTLHLGQAKYAAKVRKIILLHDKNI